MPNRGQPGDEWDNTDRRLNGKKDHDLLIRIDQNVTNFLDNFKTHVVNDDENFKDLRLRVKHLEKYVWIGIGGLGILQVIIVIANAISGYIK